MAKTIEQVIALFCGTPNDWVRHSRGDGWKRVGAQVADTAYVGPDAVIVSGDARVSGNAQVYGDAWEKSPLYIQGTRHACYWAKKGEMGIGCKVMPIEEWRAQYKEIGKQQGYTPEQIKEYGRHIRYFWLWHKEAANG